MNNLKLDRTSISMCGLFIGLGLTSCGYFMARSIERFTSHDRTVVVKGLAEREVKSDLSIWNIYFKATGNNLEILEQKMERDKKTISAFLESQGFNEEEIKFERMNVKDKFAVEYGENEQRVKNRYIIDSNVIVRTTKVDLIEKANSKVGQLIKENIIISGAPHFYYTKFSSIRPEMIAEATKSARQAALQFASDSGARVGAIRSATQGSFSISGRDSYGDNADYREQGSVEKKIRVVSTVTFSLEQ